MAVENAVARGPKGQIALLQVDANGRLVVIPGPETTVADFDQQIITAGTSPASTPFPAPNPFSPVAAVAQIVVEGDSHNTDPVYVGKTGTKADGTTGGFVVYPGQIVPLPTSDYTKYVATAVAGQKLLITYLPGQ